ncbi:MAG: DUF4412 domain-containing protein [Acetobacteraceae bacterium]
MSRLTALAVAACVAALATAALAQDKPLLQPTRDASITYKTLGSDPGRTMQISHAAAGGLTRMDMPAMDGGYAIVDRKNQRATMVIPARRAYIVLAGPQIPDPGSLPEEDAKFTRKGTDTVAGQACTVWAYTSANGNGTTCITADGLMLRGVDQDGDGMEATNISLDPLPADRFAPPAGFQKMEMPGMGGIGGPGGAPPTRPPGR